MALVTRFLLPKHPKQITTDDVFTDGKAERQLQVTQISSSWKRLLLPKQDTTKSQWVPNLSGLLKAGDEGLFSSTLFTHLQGHPGQVPLDTLYQAFSNEIRTRPLAERSSYPGDMTKFLARTKKPANSVSRSKSMSQIKRVEPSQKSQRKSLDLSVAEMGLTRSLSVKKSASPLVSVRNGLYDDGSQKAAHNSWVKDGQTAKYHSGQTNVKVTPAELTALAIILGSEPNKNVDRQLAIPETSAYGISIISTQTEDSKHHITLTQHKRSRAQRHAQGSGVSSLFAKHLAAGSLPYSEDKLGVHSILITGEAFEALQAGAPLYTHPYVARTPQSKFLASLPNSREPRFHILATSTEVHTSTTLLDAIAALPFSGGLAALASAPLIKTVQFVASGGLPPAKLLQRLEGLVDKVHRHSPHLNIFGPLYEPQNAGVLYRERDRLGRLASDPSTPDTLADKTARMSRYITLLERLMALVPDLKPQDVLEAVQEATKTEIQRSYERAVVAYAPQSHTRKSADFTSRRLSDTQPKRHSTSPRSSPPRRSNRSSVLSNVTSPSVLSNEDRDLNLAKQLEQVLKADLPLDVNMTALVARMVLVAWTLSVRVVAWEDGEDGYRVPDLEGWGKMIMS